MTKFNTSTSKVVLSGRWLDLTDTDGTFDSATIGVHELQTGVDFIKEKFPGSMYPVPAAFNAEL